MPYVLWSVVGFIARAIFSLRYRVRTKGCFEALQAKLDGGVLFLPNHSAHMDPPLLFLYFWPKYQMRPLVIEYIYRMGPLKFLMKITKAISIPNFDTSVNQYKIYKAEKSLREVSAGLKRGENFILYPAGRLKYSGKEIVGGASGAHAIVKECPNVHVMLLRTTGFWGSTFSRAFEGKSLSLGQSVKHALKALCKNGFFFLPRREILVECELDPPDLPRSGTRVEFNQYLEKWYNQYPEPSGSVVDTEPLQLVSYSFWKSDIPPLPVADEEKKEKALPAELPEEAKQKINQEIARIVNTPSLEIKAELSLAADLGMDSLNVAELIAYLSRNYRLDDVHPEDLATVGQVWQAAAAGDKKRVRRGPNLALPHWPEEKGRPSPLPPVGKTMPEAFLRSCERMRHFAACGDDVSGALSYKKMKRAVLVLANHIKHMPGDRIGILLPASVGAYICILAVQMAGKLPVMLNWTLGSRYLDDMLATAPFEVVLSSWKFLEKVQHVDFGKLMEKFQLLEDIRAELSLAAKLKGALLAHAPVSFVLRSYGQHRKNPRDPCVILFTSGTESTPKGVPLSHENILTNQRAAMLCIECRSTDVLYGILPPFHSFGFSVAGILPLVAGMKCALYPDPTDSFALAEGVERWQVTIFCGAPSFVKGLLSVGMPQQLRTVRLFVSGAEKAPPELYERVAQLGIGAKLVEGYGLTECAPIVSLMRLNLPPKGVGLPLPNVEICTIHPETEEPLPEGGEGELLIFGSNVFSGYLGNPRSAFIELHGKKWYRTGDIGYIDKDGTVILSGRLKRFTKIGGEMISLAAIESAIAAELLRQQKISPDAQALALCAEEKTPGKSDLVLFSTVPLEKEEANQILLHAGFSRLIKIAMVKKIPEIPLMGTGKTDYRRLQTFIA